MVSVLIREQWIAHGDRVSVNDVSVAKQPDFGAPVENSIAAKYVLYRLSHHIIVSAYTQLLADVVHYVLHIVN